MLELFAAGHSCFFLFFGFRAGGAGLKPASPAAQTVHIKQLDSSRAPQNMKVTVYTNQSMTSTLYHPDAKPTDNIPNVAPPTEIAQRMMCSAGASPEGVQGLRCFCVF